MRRKRKRRRRTRNRKRGTRRRERRRRRRRKRGEGNNAAVTSRLEGEAPEINTYSGITIYTPARNLHVTIASFH